ncbi:DUF4190 domain-containing protein [Streptomyces sp. SID6673]|nr:DUF4190 domain-containing protein [Streptomyces sp. SID11726]NEB26466.1 DUF4190 domain-containing protein [Streptomyces sp. SID6673]
MRAPATPPGDEKTTVNRAAPFLGPADDFSPVDSTPDAKTEQSETPRPLAYSASINKPVDDVPEEPVPPRTQTAPPQPSRSPASNRPTNRTAIWALVLSILGITAPIGLYLGYRSRASIARSRELGEPFARVAIWIGWLYVAVFVLALLTYFWIAGQGS